MVSEATSLNELIVLMAWACLILGTRHGKAMVFTKVISSQDVLEQLLTTISLTYAPGLLNILEASTPPTIAWFKSLPTDDYKRWAVYVLVLEKAFSRPKIYIGCGTKAICGVSQRFSQYDRRVALPQYVEAALKNGYDITHKGILCWSPVPAAADVPIHRLLFLVLEAVFTFVFWAVHNKKEDAWYMGNMFRWVRATLPYDGLCSHSPLDEGSTDGFKFTAEELEAKAAAALKQKTVLTEEARLRRRAEDPKTFRTKQAKNQRDVRAKHPDRVAKNRERSTTNIVAEKRHYCATCDHSFQRPSQLQRHIEGLQHRKKVALLERSASQSSGL